MRSVRVRASEVRSRMARCLVMEKKKNGQISIDFMQLRVILNGNAERRAPPFAPPRV